MKKISLIAVSVLSLILVLPAYAQRTDDNVVTQSDDAFGKTVGDEQIGIYNPDDVRGFSPIDAGNVRIEGLFFDQQAGLTDRSSIRVGISAQGYPFPAPTGIVDYSLRMPGAKNLVSVALNTALLTDALASLMHSCRLTESGLGSQQGQVIFKRSRIFVTHQTSILSVPSCGISRAKGLRLSRSGA
jgi:iron complex outermembrane receptor protein